MYKWPNAIHPLVAMMLKAIHSCGLCSGEYHPLLDWYDVEFLLFIVCFGEYHLPQCIDEC